MSSSAHKRQKASLPFTRLTREELINLLKKIAKKLGRAPTHLEFRRAVNISERHLYEVFTSYRECLEAAGLDARGSGYKLTAEQLLKDWARVVRKLKRTPSVAQYERHGRYSQSAFLSRWESWREIPAAMLQFAVGQKESEWRDVVALAQNYVRRQNPAVRRPVADNAAASRPVRVPEGPVYGRPIVAHAMANAPTNEMGVMMLFASMAQDLGFIVLRVQPGFPDCEALRVDADGRWRRVRIEFEFESRNFLLHGHDKNGCDLIVCWKHNWAGCPVEVIELSAILGQTQNL